MDNIAEGYERGGNREFIQFLYIAKGSAGELRSQLFRLVDRGCVTDEEFNRLSNDVNRIARMIAGLIRYLQRSDLKGEKFHKPKFGSSHFKDKQQPSNFEP
jgi:four helix bundle protein